MLLLKKITYGFCLIILGTNLACKVDTTEKDKADQSASEKLFVNTMQKHLDAVTNKDLSTLESTLSPEGNMQLILPGTEITIRWMRLSTIIASGLLTARPGLLKPRS